MVSYRRKLPRTLLPLDRWAQIIGIDPLHFRQVYYTDHETNTCAKVWKQYSWQEFDQLGRYDVAQAIQDAENKFAQFLGYKLLPAWESAEKHQTPKPGNRELFVVSRFDIRGYPKSVKAKWGHFMEAGIEAKSLIEAGVAIVYSDIDGDGYDETATITVATTITDEEEIAIYYPSEGGADEWEIRPLRNVSISGGNAVITCWRHQLVDPDLVEALNPEAVDGSVDANFLTTVDVYRHYNDESTQCSLIWHPNIINCNCSSSGCCPVCSHQTQDACLNAKDWQTSLLMYYPATYDEDNESWTKACLTCGRNPDLVELYYRAGLRDVKADWSTLQMDSQWERAVAYYALTLLDRDICGCDPIKSLATRMKEDFIKFGANTQQMLNNPLGTTRGAWIAWNMIANEPERIGGHGVRW